MSEDRGTTGRTGEPGASGASGAPEVRKGGVSPGRVSGGTVPTPTTPTTPTTSAAPVPGSPAPKATAPPAPAAASGEGGYRHGSPLIPRDECDKLETRMRHALAGFVDEPRGAVAEADQVLEELATRFTEAITRRRRTVRGAWQPGGAGEGGTPESGDTEKLRLALRDYRELCERLLHV